MAAFRSDAEKKKWASLEHKAGLSLQNIAKGVASASDVKAVSTALNGLSGLAKQVFDQAISAAEVSAKKFEAQYEKLHGADDGGGAQLTAYEQALNKALADAFPDLLHQIQDVVELSNLEQSEEIERVIGTKLTDFQNMVAPRKQADPASVDDVLTAQDIMVDELMARDDARWVTRKKDLLESIADVFQHTLRDLAASIKRERTAMGNGEIGHHANTPLLSGPSGGNSLVPYQSNDWHLAEQPSVLNRAMSLVGGNRESDRAPAADVIDMPTGNTATQGSTVKGADVVSLSPNTEAAITTAANDQTSLYKQLMDFLANPNGHKSGESDKAEENANAVARALKNEFGDKSSGKKSKKEKDDTSSWLKGLGGVLAAMIMDPQLFTGLAETVQKILTWDNIKKMAVSSWEYMKDQGKTIIDWVLEKLGLNKKIEQPEVDAAKDHGGAKLTKSNAQRLQDPKVQAELAKMDAGLKDQHPGAKLPEAKDPGAHQSWQSKIGNFFGIKLGDENVVKSDVANATSNPSYYANKGGNSNTTSVNANTTVTASSSANVGGNRSTVNNQANAGSITNSTVSNPGTTVKVNPGTSTPPPGASSPSGPAGTGSNAPGVGSPKIGGSSFGFQSGIDDSLPLMNSTFLVN